MMILKKIVSERGFVSVILLLVMAILSGGVGCSSDKGEDGMKKQKAEIRPPVAEKKPRELITHSHRRVDDYYWMNERENPAVAAYLEAENEYTQAVLAHTEGLRDKLFEEIVGRIKQTDISVPVLFNGYYYYDRNEDRKEYPIHCRKKGSTEGLEEVLLDVNEMAKGFDFFHVTGLSVSPDNRLLAYGVDHVSRRKYTIHVKDLTSGKTLTESIPNTTGRVVWANDNLTFFYTTKDETLRPNKIFAHTLGSKASRDREVFHEQDTTFNTWLFKSKSRKYIMIGSESTLTSEYRFLDADSPQGEFKIVEPRTRNLEYGLDHHDGHFYIRTNLDAKNFRLLKTPVTAPGRENWREVIPHRSDVLMEDLEVFKDYMVLMERKKGLRQIRIRKWDGSGDHYINFPEQTYALYFDKNREMGSQLLRFEYSSLTTPESIYDYDMKRRETRLLKREEVVGGFNPADYQSERLYAVARDGVEVPISLVYKKGFKKDGSRPLLLYAYGSYGSSMNPYFKSARLSLLDRGFAFAIAHIRGGQEMGRDWYENGKLLHKKNTFYDFIDCAKYLISEKYTAAERLFAQGGSAGGLLMGAVTNMAPDIFRGVIADVPFVDVVTTMLDESIPLTTGEYDEWGNPNDKTYYEYMLSYSPYDNVRAVDYPALLVTTGFHDSQVQYWEPAKWVAKLRDMKTDGDVVLLYTNMEAGHGGVSGRFRKHRETALEYAFMLDTLGIKE